MAISYPLAFPTHKGVRSITIRQRKVVGLSMSPFSLIPQTYEHPGEMWEADITLPPMNRAAGEAWIAWLASLRGSVGSFTMGDPAGATSRGGASGSPTATGSIRARTITVSGGSGSLYAGDWISLGGRYLHKVLANVALGGSASVEIWPALRAAVSGAACTVNGATGRWFLAETPGWDIDVASIYRPQTIKALEDLRP